MMEIFQNARGEYVKLSLALPRGLHARPSAKLAQLARSFKSNITLISENGEADAKSMLDILSLAAQKNTQLVIMANGVDAKEALNSISEFCLDSRDYYGPTDS